MCIPLNSACFDDGEGVDLQTLKSCDKYSYLNVNIIVYIYFFKFKRFFYSSTSITNSPNGSHLSKCTQLSKLKKSKQTTTNSIRNFNQQNPSNISNAAANSTFSHHAPVFHTLCGCPFPESAATSHCFGVWSKHLSLCVDSRLTARQSEGPCCDCGFRHPLWQLPSIPALSLTPTRCLITLMTQSSLLTHPCCASTCSEEQGTTFTLDFAVIRHLGCWSQAAYRTLGRREGSTEPTGAEPLSLGQIAAHQLQY